MTAEQIFLKVVSLSPLLLVKIFGLTIMLFYLGFALIILRQVDLMNRMIEAQISPVLRLIALIHLGAALAVFFLVLLLL